MNGSWVGPHTHFGHGRGLQFTPLLLLGFLLAVTVLLWPTPAHAETLPPDTDKPCADCHETENEAWAISPHATTIDPLTGHSGAACNDCHGDYIEDHPRTGAMTLKIDSTVCADCHEETFTQWQDTTHAEADVECTSCHLSHSQTLRLTDEALCVSCHKEPVEDQFHTAHWVSEVACTGCHLTTPPHDALASTDPTSVVAMSNGVPSHDFVTVAAQECLDCHRNDIETVASLPDEAATAQALLLVNAKRATTLATTLQATESQLRALGIMTPVALGIGLGMGGFFGIVFMLLLSYWGAKKGDL